MPTNDPVSRWSLGHRDKVLTVDGLRQTPRVDAGFSVGLRRLEVFTTRWAAELESSATITTGTVGPYLSVWLEPLRAEALGIGWLQSDVEVILSTGSGGRWELEPTDKIWTCSRTWSAP